MRKLPGAFRIMVIDDNRADLDFLEEAVRTSNPPRTEVPSDARAQITVISLTDGLTALNHLQTSKERVDLIICDLQMPMISGINLLQAILEDEDLREIPFTLTSGTRSRHAALALRDRLEVPYYDKPATYRGYQHLAREILAALQTAPPGDAAKRLANRMMIG